MDHNLNNSLKYLRGKSDLIYHTRRKHSEYQTRIMNEISSYRFGDFRVFSFLVLAKKHDVTFYEKDNRAGGHSNTVILESEKGVIPVDTGFIVYNEKNYPNLVHFFENLGVATQNSEMSFSVSRNN